MSVLDVMNYVRSTPRNTNPAVIASMVENEQRSAVHEEVASLQEIGAIGDIEWVPFGSFTKAQLGFEDEVQEFGMVGYSASPLLTEGQLIKVRLKNIETESQVFRFEKEGIPILAAGNNLSGNMRLGDWILADVDFASVFNIPVRLIFCSIFDDAQQVEIFNGIQRGISPQYIAENILIKQTTKKIMEVPCVLESNGVFVGMCEQQLQPGKRYLVSDGERTQEMVCGIFPIAMGSETEEGLVFVYGGNPAIFGEDDFPFELPDTGEDFLYFSGMIEMPDTISAFVTLEPKTLTIEEIGYSNELNEGYFKGKMGSEVVGDISFMSFDERDPNYVCHIKNNVGFLYKHPIAPFNPYEITKIKWWALLSGGESKPIVHECVDKNGVEYYAVGCERDEDLIDSLIYISYSPFTLNTWDGERTLEAGVYVTDLDGWRIREVFRNGTVINKIEPKYLPEGLGYSEFEPQKIFVYSGSYSNYQYVDLGNWMYYIKLSPSQWDLSIIRELETKDLFGRIEIFPITEFKQQYKTDLNNKSYLALVPLDTGRFSGFDAIIVTDTTITISGSNGTVTVPTGTWLYQDHNDDFNIMELHGEEQETVYPIPQKYIPALDSIILNGADGKQYSLTVDTNGQLSVKLI